MTVGTQGQRGRDPAAEQTRGGFAEGRSGAEGISPLERWDGREVVALRQAWGVPRLEAYERIGSTSDRAAELARSAAPAWTVVVADEQTRGRGRQGTMWVSLPRAGLWMSVVVDDPGSTGLSLLAGLACAEAAEALAPGVHVGLKWPNDLMLDDAKVGGVLCETVGGSVVVGIGINVTRAPADLPATSLEASASKPMERSDLAASLVGRLRHRFALPLSAVHAELARRDILAGRTVDTEQEGPARAAGIDASGALRVVRPDGSEVRVVSGGVRLQPRDRGRRGDPDGGPPPRE